MMHFNRKKCAFVSFICCISMLLHSTPDFSFSHKLDLFNEVTEDHFPTAIPYSFSAGKKHWATNQFKITIFEQQHIQRPCSIHFSCDPLDYAMGSYMSSYIVHCYQCTLLIKKCVSSTTTQVKKRFFETFGEVSWQVMDKDKILFTSKDQGCDVRCAIKVLN